MNDVSQLATAVVAVAFTAMLLISGQWFVDYRLQHDTIGRLPIATTLSP